MKIMKLHSNHSTLLQLSSFWLCAKGEKNINNNNDYNNKTPTANAEPSDATRHVQRAWDNTVVITTFTDLLSACTTPVEKTRLKAVRAPHAGDWLNAPPITAVGLRLSDEAVRVAVGQRLGSTICQPHTYICGTQVDARGLHDLSSRMSGPRTSATQS